MLLRQLSMLKGLVLCQPLLFSPASPQLSSRSCADARDYLALSDEFHDYPVLSHVLFRVTKAVL